MNDGSKLALTLVLAIAAAHFLLGGRGALIWRALTGPGDPLGTMFHVSKSSGNTLSTSGGGLTF